MKLADSVGRLFLQNLYTIESCGSDLLIAIFDVSDYRGLETAPIGLVCSKFTDCCRIKIRREG